jgi:mannose-6-phosphate isomerase-like protein (cupin superfamily)
MEVEIYEYNGENYNPTMNSDSWRVAFLNYGDAVEKSKLSFLERHHLTDEVFVLLEGDGTLLIGMEKKPLEMEKNKIYNVKKDVWHTIFMTPKSKVLIVENDNTAKENSEYYYFK